MHTYVIGATGSGKSNYLLCEMEGAFAFLDKHGTTARQIADSLPCVYWRPADLDFPIGLNPLANVAPDQRWKRTADIVSVFSDIWKLGPETPRLLYYLRGAIGLLLGSTGTTLLDIRRVLSDASYRNALVRRSSGNQLVQTWSEFNTKDDRQKATEKYARHGLADILVVKDGRAVFLEVKAEKGKQSPEQIDFGSDAILAGAAYHVVRSIEEVQAIRL